MPNDRRVGRAGCLIAAISSWAAPCWWCHCANVGLVSHLPVMTILTVGDQTTISYSDGGGGGVPVLLVHGITENATAWDPVAERLSADYRVITMDLRGHGGSGKAERYDLEAMAGDVVAGMQAMDLLGEVHLVGHSLGGAVVSAVGAVAPVRSIVNGDQSLQLGA